MQNEIIETRNGGLGSSDAKMVEQIGRLGYIPESAKKRIAVMLGLDEPVQFSTTATDHGHFIENKIFEYIQSSYPQAVSNPYRKEDSLSESLGFDVLNHIDIEVETDAYLWWFECKAVNASLEETLKTYDAQLQWHRIVGEAKANSLSKAFRLTVAYYHTDTKDFEFNSENIVFHKYDSTAFPKEILDGLGIISQSIKDFKYEKKEELTIMELPESVQLQLKEIAFAFDEIKKQEAKVEEFKKTMYESMLKNGVKSIDNEYFKMTLVAPTESISFDQTKLKSEQPDIYNRYTKKVTKKGFLKITTK